jgi:hypothetical protein
MVTASVVERPSAFSFPGVRGLRAEDRAGELQIARDILSQTNDAKERLRL